MIFRSLSSSFELVAREKFRREFSCGSERVNPSGKLCERERGATYRLEVFNLLGERLLAEDLL